MIVYVLRSLSHPSQSYIGLTEDLERRLTDHNAGRSNHTSRFRPWEVLVAIHFADSLPARRFEKYLKSGSGHAFLKTHFWPEDPGPQF